MSYMYILAFEYININRGNVDRILEDALQRSEIISISLRSKFWTDFDTHARAWREFIVHNCWSYAQHECHQVDTHRPFIFFIKSVQDRGFISNRWKSTSTDGNGWNFNVCGRLFSLLRTSVLRIPHDVSTTRSHDSVRAFHERGLVSV